MEEFELYTDYKIKGWNLNMKVSTIVFFFAIFFIIIQNLISSNLLNYMNLTLVVLFIVSKIVELHSFFSKYDHKKGQRGRLIISEINIFWNEKEIKWNQITGFEIQYLEIDNQHKWDLGPQNNVSDGFNLVSIKTKNENFEGHYKIKDKHQIIRLKDLLWRSILQNKISYEIAKNIVQPNNYKEHQELKHKLVENTDNNALEGQTC